MSFPLATFYARTRTVRKMVVVDLGFLGDSVHLVPALVELRRHYSDAELHTISAPVGAELLQLVPAVSRAWAFPLGSPSPPWWRHWDLLLALRRERFELAWNFSGADRSLFLAAVTGARWRVAHAGGRRHFWNRWLIREWVPRRSLTLPVYEQRRQVLAACGLTIGQPVWPLEIPQAARRRAETLVPAGSVHLSINASTPLKEWPLPHWVILSRQLLDAMPKLVLVASGSNTAREQQRLAALKTGVNTQRMVILPPALGIGELAAVLQRCRLHVGGDSGVLHLAAALKVPTLALFRDYPNKTEWLPHAPEHRHIIVPCECVDSPRPPCPVEGPPQCLQGLAPERVLPLLRELLAR